MKKQTIHIIISSIICYFIVAQTLILANGYFDFWATPLAYIFCCLPAIIYYSIQTKKKKKIEIWLFYPLQNMLAIMSYLGTADCYYLLDCF